MHQLDVAILKTIIYGDIFDFPMTSQEIHHFLIYHRAVDASSVTHRLQNSPDLSQKLCFDGMYYALASHQQIVELRHQREDMMTQLGQQVEAYGRLVFYMPFVEFVGVTGALSMRNPSTATDDLDYLVITKPGRVWLARAFIILLVRLMRLRRVEICPNYVLASDQLAQSRQDLYIAHELAQVLPIANDAVYRELRDLNTWTNDHLPNAQEPFYVRQAKANQPVGMIFKRVLEGVLSTPIGRWLEQWEFRRKARRFQQQADNPNASAQIDEGHVKGHFQDYGQYVLEQYQQRLAEHRLDGIEPVLKSVGD